MYACIQTGILVVNLICLNLNRMTVSLRTIGFYEGCVYVIDKDDLPTPLLYIARTVQFGIHF